MPVYVDDMNTMPLGHYRGMHMCHMIADTTEELLAMADKISVQRKWIQNAGTRHEHFDICTSKKKLAVRQGAIEIEYGAELVEMLEQRDRDEQMTPRRKS